MKIGFYDPYLDTMGGGEKYFLDAASYVSKNGHSISFFWRPDDKNNIARKAKERFNIDIASFSFLPDIFSSHQSLLTKYQTTKSFDAIFYLSDGSIPFLFSKNNILMFQHPVDWVNGKNALNQLKLKNINTIICNSDFVKSHIDKTFSQNKSIVVYPPAMNVKRDGNKKENIILSVGRFTQAMNAKKHDILIAAFKKLHEKEKNWQLILAGGMREEDKESLVSLQKLAVGLPISFETNISYDCLLALYNKARIYWHAAGYGENIAEHPERTEHFGISIVEAMSAGCIPFAFDAGGSAEIIDQEKYGFLWKTIDELVEKTEKIIADDS